MNFYAVGALFKSKKVMVFGNTENINLTWADGMIGCMPIFATKEAAQEYAAEEGFPVIEFEAAEEAS